MTDTLSIIKALGGDPATGMCCCPAHDDKRASLHISEKSGKVLWKCHAGCTQERVRQALIGKGLWSKNRTTTQASPRGQQQSESNASARGQARKEANRIWKEAKPAWERHTYCKQKQVEPTGLKMERRDSASPLLVPVYDKENKLVNIQFIHTDGKKHYIKDGQSKDCHFWIEKPREETHTILICEGWATGKSAFDATKYAVIMTFGKCNLLSVAKWVRKQYPDHKIILLADDDGGDGIEKANEAARAVNGLVAIPKCFGPGQKKYGKDFNDLCRRINYEGVKCQIDAATKPEPDTEELDEGAVGRKVVDSLVGLAADAELFHTSDLVGYADMTIDGHRETWPIKAKGFRSWLLHQYYRATGSAPAGEALRLAIETIDAKARYDGPTMNISLRVGGDSDRIYIDLCDKEWRAVEIDQNSWRIVSTPPVRFRRAPGMLALPTPVKGGNIDELRRFVNVKSSGDFVLLVSFIVAALRDRGPYAGLALKGEEGSAKSTLAKLTRDLIDPHKVRARSQPRENRDLHVAANASHVIAFDNVSQIPDWLSDALCSLATGGGFATRALYTDMDEILFEAMRPVILNGIEYATRSDLADRLIFLNLPPITDDARSTEREFWEAFESARPRILGVLCDALAYGLRMLPDTPTENLPRMADYAQWSVAWEGALFEPGSFMKAYARNRKSATLDVIENDDVAVAVVKLMAKNDEWSGTATELLKELGMFAGEKIEKSKDWPASANSLSRKLRRAAKPLRKIGLVIDKERMGRRGTRAIVIRRQTQEGPENIVSSVSTVRTK